MTALTDFFGKVYLVGIVFCGLVWLFSPHTGQEIAKRAGLSFLLFAAASFVLPTAGDGVLFRSVCLLLSFTLFLAALFYLIDPERARGLLGAIAILALASVTVCLVLR